MGNVALVALHIFRSGEHLRNTWLDFSTSEIHQKLGENSRGNKCQWIGLRENLQETMAFTIKFRAFL